MSFRLRQTAACALLAMGAASAFADNAHIFYDTDGDSTAANTGLTTLLTGAGYTVTNQVGVPAGTNLSGNAQVWDIRVYSSGTLSSPDQATYLGYLQGGGALFLMGENSAFMARNNSIISFVTLAGGGTAVFSAPTSNTQTIQGSVATSPNSISTVSFAGAGALSSVGTGTCLTKDAGNKCVAVGYGHNKLANATGGTLVVVMDVNFLQPTYLTGNTQLFAQNLIAYLESGGGPATGGAFVPVSSKVTNGVGATLDGLVGASVIQADMAATVGALGQLDDAHRATAMSRLTPAANNSLSRLGAGAVSYGLSNVAGRLEGVRNAGALAWSEPSIEKMVVATNGPISGLVEGKALRHGFWGKAFGADTRQDSQDGFAGYGASTWGLTMGADTRLLQGTVVGAAVSYAKTTLDQRDFLTGSGNEVDNYQVIGYANHDFGTWYVDGMLSYGQQRYKSHRDTNVTGVAKANYDGDMTSVRVAAGKPLQLNEKLTATPFASLEYSRMTQNGYQENGASVLNLTVSATSAERTRSGLGVSLAGEANWGSTRVHPAIHVQWLHDFNNDGISTTSSFAGGGAAFATPGQKIDSDLGNIGGSLSFSVTKNASLSLRYDYEGSPQYHNQTGQIIGQLWF